MDTSDPAILFLGLILPSLFALTLIGEGVWKISKSASGWISIILGLIALAAIASFYFLVL